MINIKRCRDAQIGRLYILALCSVPFALCPVPFALRPVPFALCPVPFALCFYSRFIALRSANASFSLTIKVSSPFLSHTLGS